ncbi:PREDICTED: MKI67 FHA domain-interacting nucleolar phosphoprotein-like [Atta colombica]|uniref:MKI67 FHA domain-interacting nucleolar phosphoprotein-like n=1 Tax=Atta colombica TaxID=520822 RepID=UPI00084C2F1E|nr:PREDICTED: MKI67 FHA domain-interacting nucleolar phosphoprotein-like [Atta colombica]
MKVKKEDVMFKELVLRKNTKNILKPKASASLEKAVKNVKQIFKTGKSRGYGYVEFLHSQVAKIAADTMNNYLMCGRLLKATYIPPEKQHSGFFLGINWSEDKYPRLKNRRRTTLSRNLLQSAGDHEKYVQRLLDKLSALENKLQEKGISIKFQPVDI